MTKFPTLYAKAKDGGLKEWTIKVVKDTDGTADIVTENGKVGGRMAHRLKHISEGKNIGKTNETSPLEQAYLEAESSWTEKKERKEYTESQDDAQKHESIRPMLAHKYKDRKKYIKWPAMVQPKLDGMRCIAQMTKDGGLLLTSRQGKDLYPVLSTNEKLIEAIKAWMTPGQILDGELYYHGWSLQRITAAAKKSRDDTMLLQYWVFDNATPGDKMFINRWEVTTGGPVALKSPLYLLTTKKVTNEEQMLKWHGKFVDMGYEGTIIRNIESVYLHGHRSNDLLKYKDHLTEEFQIIGINTEFQDISGKHYECIMFRCKTKDGAEFNVRPRGTLEHRQELLKIGNKFIGQPLTVRFQTYTDDTQGSGKRVPQFPVGVIVRNYE